METHSPTINTLTAEVRTLMVNNRQVTTSVAKQLDQVDPSRIEPMGRVRLGVRDRSDVSVIGRVKGGADLVTADYMNPLTRQGNPVIRFGRKSWITVDTTRRHPVGLDGWESGVNSLTNPNGRVAYVSGAVMTPAHSDVHTVSPAELAQLHADAISEWDARVAQSKSFDSLPLIVLAGLK